MAVYQPIVPWRSDFDRGCRNGEVNLYTAAVNMGSNRAEVQAALSSPSHRPGQRMVREPVCVAFCGNAPAVPICAQILWAQL